MKYLDLRTGSFISLALALMMLVPRMVRFDDLPIAVFFLGLLNAFGFAFFCWICQRILLFGQPWVALMPKWWVRSAVFLLICPVASILHYQLAGSWLLHAYFFETLDEKQISTLLCFRGLLIGGFMLMTSYYLNELAKAQQSKLELQQLKQENLEARLKSLREQLSPHFLFNSLNTLQSMSADKEVKDFIIHLADVYRYLLGLQDNHLVSISEELAFIRSYIFVLKARFEEALQVNISVNSECELLCVPPLAIQSLIENAIKHNIVSRQKPLEVSVTCEGTKWLVVTNNKQLKLHVNSTGFGLASINDRYRLLADLEIEIHDQPESFIVKLPLLKC